MLATEDRENLINFLKDLPDMATERQRRQMLENAGLEKLISYIDFSGPSHVASTEIVDKLASYGQVAAGNEALHRFLNTIKNFVGVDKQRFLDDLQKKYDKITTIGRKRRVFISHWAVENTTNQFLEHLNAVLCNEGYEVLPNMNLLREGAAWDNSIYLYINVAHAAVLLFSPGALAAEWFKKEVGVLIARTFMNDNIVLIPVLLDLSREDVQNADFAPWYLEHVFQLNPPIIHHSNDDVVKAIVDRLEKLQNKELARSAYEKLERHMIELLESVDKDVIVDAATKLNIEIPANASIDTCRSLLAKALWHSSALQWEITLNILAEKEKIDRSSFIEWIAPSWVDPYASRWIIGAALKNSPCRMIALNGTYTEFTAKMFIRRAYCLAPLDPYKDQPNNQPKIILVETVADGASPQVHIKKIRDAIKREILDDPELADTDFDTDIQDELIKYPVFVVIPAPLPDQQFLDELLAAFPWPAFTFFLLTKILGANPNDHIEKHIEVVYQNITLIQPKLQEREERTAYKQYTRIKKPRNEKRS